MRRKFSATLAAVLAVAGAALFSLAAPASAQTGSGMCAGPKDVGTVNVGDHFVIQVAPDAPCLFTPSTPVTVAVNGVTIPGKAATAGGVVLVDVTVLSTTQLSIDDPTIVPALCGTNTVTATGPSRTAAGGVSTQTARFNIACPVAPVTPAAFAPATTIAVTGGVVLSRTGADSLRYAAFALALVAAGALAVLVTRRRRAA